jgi:hypothetical protein
MKDNNTNNKRETIYLDCEIYEGQFEDGKKHELGKLTSTSSKIIRESRNKHNRKQKNNKLFKTIR